MAVVGLWLAILLQIAHERRVALHDAEVDLTNLTRAFAEHTTKTLEGADQELRFVRGEVLAHGQKFDLARRIGSGELMANDLLLLSFTDARGDLVQSSLPAQPASFADRDYFRFQQGAASDVMYVGRPVVGRVTGKPSIPLSRRITLPDGTFGGVAMLSLSPAYLSRFYTQVDLGGQGIVMLLGADGEVRASAEWGNKSGPWRLLDVQGGELLCQHMAAQLISQSTALTGAQRRTCLRDDVERIFTWRRIDGYGLTIVTAKGLDEVLAPARQRAWVYLTLATLLSPLLLWLIAALRRNLSDQNELVARLMRSEERYRLGYEEKRRGEAVIWRQANFDELTGLPNRRLFGERLTQSLEAARADGRTIAVLFIDLDHFKDVNDALGHLVGDTLLQEAARRLLDSLRAEDTLARMGGDEFTVLLESIRSKSDAEAVIGKILGLLAKPFWIREQAVYVSGSVGVAFFPDDGDAAEALLKHADRAMYSAKELGRNQSSRFTEAMQEDISRRFHLGGELRSALARRQFEVYYQPIIDLKTGRIARAEALLRWHHDTLGNVPPSEFIPLAEELGLIGEIGDWVFREAAALAKRLYERGRAGGRRTSYAVQISVNKSPKQLLTGSTQREWPAHLREIGLPAGLLCIEITESTLLDPRPAISGKLADLQRDGFGLAIDDFGVGYSNLAYLKKYNIDDLKIDRSFVSELSTCADDRAIVEAIIVMAHKIGIKVTAEGVETVEQRDLLLKAGCDFAQGFLFHRPMPALQFEALVLSQAAIATAAA